MRARTSYQIFGSALSHRMSLHLRRWRKNSAAQKKSTVVRVRFDRTCTLERKKLQTKQCGLAHFLRGINSVEDLMSISANASLACMMMAIRSNRQRIQQTPESQLISISVHTQLNRHHASKLRAMFYRSFRT